MIENETSTIEDVQSGYDGRQIPVTQVGIKGYRHPVAFSDGAAAAPVVVAADFDLYVDLPGDVKGTHMSRFIEMLGTTPLSLSSDNLGPFMDDMITRLGADNGYVSIQFPFFIEKSAPISGVKSLMDYHVKLQVICENHELLVTTHLEIPITTLCPCSKTISEYGAHNQRSLITIAVQTTQAHEMSIASLIKLVETHASSELFSVLKRPDEKYVTEKAYDNPKFVEDMVRDIAHTLKQIEPIQGFSVASENFESIHNHSAFAHITHQFRPLPHVL